MRSQLALERLNGPFDPFAHVAEVRRINNSRGRHNIPNIGIFLSRLSAFPATNVLAKPVQNDAIEDHRRYFFNPLGIDTPLFSHPQPADSMNRSDKVLNISAAISRRQLKASMTDYYGSSLKIQIGTEELPFYDIVVCNLEDIPGGQWAHGAPDNKVAIDPELGRLVVGEGKNGLVRVSFHYGFSAPMGGGEYEREQPPFESTPLLVPDDFPTIQEAFETLHGAGVVEITRNDIFEENLHINMQELGTLILIAADKRRPLLKLADEMVIEGLADSHVILDGLLIHGSLIRIRGPIKSVSLRHCTLVPGLSFNTDITSMSSAQLSLICEAPNVSLQIENSIVGAMEVITSAEVTITNSIVDATNEQFAAYGGIGSTPGGKLNVENCTFIGKVNTLQLDASNSIFMSYGVTPADQPVRSERLQAGCVRYCYIPPGSRVSHPYRCQPINKSDATRVRPVFTSLKYNDPGYCQLQHRCAKEILRGADDEAEMGAFHDLFQPQRQDNLRARVDEYLRLGLEAGFFYIN